MSKNGHQKFSCMKTEKFVWEKFKLEKIDMESENFRK